MFRSLIRSVLISSIGIASSQLFVSSPLVAQQANIDTSSLCGTWQAIPGSGDFVYGPEDFPIKKVKGETHGTINYNIHTHGKRTLRATQTVSIITPLDVDGIRLSGGKTRTINEVQKYHGVVQENSLYLTSDSQTGTQKWLKLPGNKFDVIVLHSGKYPSASQFTVEQTAKRTCK
jgi:hypothetical protein